MFREALYDLAYHANDREAMTRHMAAAVRIAPHEWSPRRRLADELIRAERYADAERHYLTCYLLSDLKMDPFVSKAQGAAGRRWGARVTPETDLAAMLLRGSTTHVSAALAWMKVKGGGLTAHEDTLLAGLATDDGTIRGHLVQELCDLESDSLKLGNLESKARRLLSHEDPIVRSAALRVLVARYHGAAHGLQAATRALEDPVDLVRFEAVRAVHRHHGGLGQRIIASLLEQEPDGHFKRAVERWMEQQ